MRIRYDTETLLSTLYCNKFVLTVEESSERRPARILDFFPASGIFDASLDFSYRTTVRYEEWNASTPNETPKGANPE